MSMRIKLCKIWINFIESKRKKNQKEVCIRTIPEIIGSIITRIILIMTIKMIITMMTSMSMTMIKETMMKVVMVSMEIMNSMDMLILINNKWMQKLQSTFKAIRINTKRQINFSQISSMVRIERLKLQMYIKVINKDKTLNRWPIKTKIYKVKTDILDKLGPKLVNHHITQGLILISPSKRITVCNSECQLQARHLK